MRFFHQPNRPKVASRPARVIIVDGSGTGAVGGSSERYVSEPLTTLFPRPSEKLTQLVSKRLISVIVQIMLPSLSREI